MQRPDPELLPFRPSCPKCTMRMITTVVSPGPKGFEQRTCECLKCGYVAHNVIASDPLQSDVVGWLRGELGRDELKPDD